MISWVSKTVFSRGAMTIAFPTSTNDQVTDSVTQTHVNTLGDIPSIALANLTQATAQAISNAAHNQTAAQQQTGIIAQASTAACATTLQAFAALAAGRTASSHPASKKKDQP